jgi:hypothetical protein
MWKILPEKDIFHYKNQTIELDLHFECYFFQKKYVISAYNEQNESFLISAVTGLEGVLSEKLAINDDSRHTVIRQPYNIRKALI